MVVAVARSEFFPFPCRPVPHSQSKVKQSKAKAPGQSDRRRPLAPQSSSPQRPLLRLFLLVLLLTPPHHHPRTHTTPPHYPRSGAHLRQRRVPCLDRHRWFGYTRHWFRQRLDSTRPGQGFLRTANTARSQHPRPSVGVPSGSRLPACSRTFLSGSLSCSHVSWSNGSS